MSGEQAMGEGPQKAFVHEALELERSLAEMKAKQPKVRFQIMSDLHFEGSVRHDWGPNDEYSQWPPGGWPVLAKYLILAGDIGRIFYHPEKLKEFFAARCKEYKFVFYVIGNRDPPSVKYTYREAVKKVVEMAQDPIMGNKLWILNRTPFDVFEKGVRITILGCTLWTKVLRHQMQKIQKDNLEGIHGNTVSLNNSRHDTDMEWLAQQVKDIRRQKDGMQRKIMVVTHHPPFIRGASKGNYTFDARYTSNYSMYGNDILGGAGFPGLGEGDMWVYGHTHYTNDTVVDGVRVYSNQRGTRCPQIIPNPNEHEFNVHRVVDF